jgi:hypothetical protein
MRCAVAALLLSCALASSAGASTRIQWTAPFLVTPAPAPPSGELLEGVTCASISFCVAVGSSGYVVSSTNPAAGAGAWSAVKADADEHLSAVSCPTSSLCVAADLKGNILTSTSPASGAGAWTVAPVDPSGRGITGVSCPTTSLCVAVDYAGDVVTSTNPTGGATAWVVTPVDLSPTGYLGANPMYAVSCASASMCAAVDFVGNVIVSSSPTGGAGSWAASAISRDILFDVACPATSLCLAAASNGDVHTSTAPDMGPSAWKASEVEPHTTNVTAVACASITFCVAGDIDGDLTSARNPTGGAGAWTSQRVAQAITGVACPSTTLCIAVDRSGRAIVGQAGPPTLTVTPQAVRLRELLSHGLPLTVACSQHCDASVVLTLGARLSRRAHLSTRASRKGALVRAVIGRISGTINAGSSRLITVPIAARARRHLRRFSRLTLTATTSARSAGGTTTTSRVITARR